MDRVVTFYIIDPENKRLLIQKRSPTRRLFPNRWEVPGGHMEAGENPETCIKRELKEELSLSLVGIIDKIHEFDWDDAGTKVHNEAYLVLAEGQVILEKDKATECMWIDKSQIGILLATGKDTGGPYEAAKKAFEWMDINAKQLTTICIRADAKYRLKNYIFRALLWGALDPQQGVIALDNETLNQLCCRSSPTSPSANDKKHKKKCCPLIP